MFYVTYIFLFIFVDLHFVMNLALIYAYT